MTTARSPLHNPRPTSSGSCAAWVWAIDHSKARGIDRLVLLSIVETGPGGWCWASLRSAAQFCALAEVDTQDAIERLISLGDLHVASEDPEILKFGRPA